MFEGEIMTKNNTVIERFREKFDTDIIKYDEDDPVIIFLTEELEKEWQQGYEAGVLQTQGEIVEKIGRMKFSEREAFNWHNKGYNQALKDIEQMIERK